ncbi:hypothetical protein ACN47E_001069 [Coniothyrium glycines]
MIRKLLLLLTLVVICAARSTQLENRACNNSPLLCSVAYDQVTHLGAHDSPFIRDGSTGFSSFGNQFFNTTVQLDAGVRLLTAQVHIALNSVTKLRELHLCHSSCMLFDAGPLEKWLAEVRAWMDTNLNEVVTLLLVNMNGADARELEAEYAKANIAQLAYVPPSIDHAPPPSTKLQKSWPSLGEMIDAGTRLVTFVNPLTADKAIAPYLLNEFDFVWENQYDVVDKADFTCTPDRPSNTLTAQEMRSSGKLFLMNHLLYWQQAFGIRIPDSRKISDTNSWDGPGGLGKHMLQCSGEVARQPTFVLVDFFNVGPAIATVDKFNGLKVPVGRKAVSSAVQDEDEDVETASQGEKGERTALCALAMAIAATVIMDNYYPIL